ncbi:MAG: AIM24 family protein [Methanobacteriaceae archaeon]
MSKYSLENFVEATIQKEDGSEIFELENDYIVDVHVNGNVKVKLGSMIAYTGDIKFKKESSLSGGLTKFVKKTMTGEKSPMMDCDGFGHLYIADDGKRVKIIELENDTIFVNGSDILAFEESIEWDIVTLSSSGMMTGGFFSMKLSGTGFIAITSHYTPLTLKVTHDTPVYTDPDATIAWSDGLNISTKSDINVKTLIGKSSGETFQMEFTGEGFVIVQPFEEVYIE